MRGILKFLVFATFITRMMQLPSAPSNMFSLRMNKSSRDAITFPEEDEIIAPRIEDLTKCSNGRTYCETFDKYPTSHVKYVMRENPVYKALFGEEEESEFITRRDEEETFLCKSKVETIFPKVGKNINNEWRFIINQKDDGFVQGIRVETCKSEDLPCDIIGEMSAVYVTKCKQKYVRRRMLSLTNQGEPVPDTFLMPSACCCSYKSAYHFMFKGALG
ncbi:protein spaetzle-like [Aethina tumida]|uniref:protein spaetzle-like n=1 Tax=Aethina tumida TaxID=116153 RepID=UPI002148A57F|nr:protein spaetzle-like [Aethina tumida]XP_049821108.1 protein spaetzle-like [Aethina tumida]